MTHFGFVVPPYLGHLNPMTALARALMAKGHAVTLFGIADLAHQTAEALVPFVALGAASHPVGSLRRMTGRLAKPGGFGLFRVMADMAALTNMLCTELPAALATGGVDAVITDQLEAAGGLVARALGIPVISVANALPINREPLIPPPFTAWSFEPSDYGLWRNQGGYRVADLLMRPMAQVIRHHAERLGLPPRDRVDQCTSETAELMQVVPGLDFPRKAMPATMHACGPLRGPDLDNEPIDLPLDGRPLVFASLGSLQGGRASLFHRIAAACAANDLQLVLAHGGRLSPEACAAFPGQPIVRSFVAQRAVLKHASLAITNGGLNTVLDALTADVPLIVVPIAFEQGAIAARVVRSGVGLSIPQRTLTAKALDAALQALFATDCFRKRARDLGTEIRAAGGVDRAVAVIEAVTGRSNQQASIDVSAIEPTRLLEPA